MSSWRQSWTGQVKRNAVKPLQTLSSSHRQHPFLRFPSSAPQWGRPSRGGQPALRPASCPGAFHIGAGVRRLRCRNRILLEKNSGAHQAPLEQPPHAPPGDPPSRACSPLMGSAFPAEPLPAHCLGRSRRRPWPTEPELPSQASPCGEQSRGRHPLPTGTCGMAPLAIEAKARNVRVRPAYGSALRVPQNSRADWENWTSATCNLSLRWPALDEAPNGFRDT